MTRWKLGTVEERLGSGEPYLGKGRRNGAANGRKGVYDPRCAPLGWGWGANPLWTWANAELAEWTAADCCGAVGLGLHICV